MRVTNDQNATRKGAKLNAEQLKQHDQTSGHSLTEIEERGISGDDKVHSATEQHLSANPLIDNVLTYLDLMARLHVPKRTLERLVSKSQIPHIKLGRHVRFYWPEIEAWLRNQKRSRV
jgi:excisionase family DNA binding protein